MNKPDAVLILKELIRVKEAEQRIEEALIKEQFAITCERLKPINLIKSTMQEINTSSELKAALPGAALSLVSNYVLKKIIPTGPPNEIIKLIGSLLGMFSSRSSENRAGPERTTRLSR